MALAGAARLEERRPAKAKACGYVGGFCREWVGCEGTPGAGRPEERMPAQVKACGYNCGPCHNRSTGGRR